MTPNFPFTLGVTGGIGSGKSEVCRIFDSLGARVFYADLEARRIMTENTEVRREIAKAFGRNSYLPDGSLNRAYLAQQVFGNEDQVAKINAIVHPRVGKAFLEMKRRAHKDGVRLLVHEAALIFESGADKRLDAVAVVHSPVNTRIERVMTRDDVSSEQVESRMKHQLPAEELLQRADYIIENTGSLEELRQRVVRLYETITHKS